MAAAAFMINDGGMPGRSITIYEAGPLLDGSPDAGGSPEHGYSMRGGRMLTTDNYECMWNLSKSIPSLPDSNKTVFDEGSLSNSARLEWIADFDALMCVNAATVRCEAERCPFTVCPTALIQVKALAV